jgi:hypothetical protein
VGTPTHHSTASLAVWRRAAGSPRARTHLEQLGHAYVSGVAVADLLAEPRGLNREPVSTIDVAVQQGECGATRLKEIFVTRLAQPFRRVGVLGHGRLESRRA